VNLQKAPGILFAVFLSAAASLALPSAARGQKAVLLVRHGEKISEEDERLTEAGRARAGRLAEVLKKSEISAIYSTDTERTIGTAQPLAESIGLKIRIYDMKPVEGRFDFTPFVERLRVEVPDGVVLVVGHSNTVPPLLRALGCAEEVSIASDEYDNLFVVVPKATGGSTLVRLRY
jgi:broad specificity phosphatase PhoE